MEPCSSHRPWLCLWLFSGSSDDTEEEEGEEEERDSRQAAGEGS